MKIAVNVTSRLVAAVVMMTADGVAIMTVNVTVKAAVIIIATETETETETIDLTANEAITINLVTLFVTVT